MSAESPECTAKHPQTDASAQTHTHAHGKTHYSQYTTQLYFKRVIYFFFFLHVTESHARISENTLRPDCRELPTAYVVIYSCIFAYQVYCVVYGGLILST